LNDECNLAVYDGDMAKELLEDFSNDLGDAREITYEQWKKRPVWEKFQELFGRLIERQQ
jgi:cardiolipin synthase